MFYPAAKRDADEVEAIELDLATDRYPDLQQVLAYWERKRGDRFAPARPDIDPTELVQVLPRIMLADVLDDPIDFRYRLAGTGIRNVHGNDMTGRSPRELEPPAYGALIFGHYCEAVRRRVPLLHLIVLDAYQRSRSYARLLLPLSSDGERVTMLMAVDGKEQNSQALKDYFARR
jgi:hypothetical protein